MAPDGTPANPLSQTAFTYDAVGNRTLVAQTSGTDAAVNTGYSANTLNQYTAVGGSGLTYDANGNLATSVSGTFGYDAHNRLTTIASGTNTVSLAYDGLNRAVNRTVNGTSTHLIYDRDWNIIEENDNSGTQLAAMAYGAATDEPIFRWASGYILSYYHQDALGNVTTLTDTSGIPVESYRYDVYGQPTIYDPYLNVRTVSFFGNPYMFTGREFLAEAGLYQYRNRAYSPGLGRFLQTDPIGFAAGDPSLYRYVSNNPINWIDSFGLEADINLFSPNEPAYTSAKNYPNNPNAIIIASHGSPAGVDMDTAKLIEKIKENSKYRDGIPIIFASCEPAGEMSDTSGADNIVKYLSKQLPNPIVGTDQKITWAHNRFSPKDSGYFYAAPYAPWYEYQNGVQQNVRMQPANVGGVLMMFVPATKAPAK